MTQITVLNILNFMLKFYDISCATNDNGHTAKMIIVLQHLRQSEFNIKISPKMLYKSKQRLYLKKWEWCAS